MIFKNPYAFSLLILLALLILWMFFKKRNPNTLLLYSLPESLRPSIKKTRWIQRFLFLATALSLIALIFGAAMPVKEHKQVRKWAEGIDILFVLDVSESMDATDFMPNRLVVAKAVLKQFVESRSQDRIGLIAFGGEAVTKVPLTNDYSFLLEQIDQLALRELTQGTAIGMAVANGVRRLKDSKANTRVIILMTDGDSNVGEINPMTASQLAREEGIKIYTIGIGKDMRVEVPVYALDPLGNKSHLITKIPSYLNPELLEKMSRLTGGVSYMAKDATSLRKIISTIDQLEKNPEQVFVRTEQEHLYERLTAIALGLLFFIFLLKETRFRRVTLASH